MIKFFRKIRYDLMEKKPTSAKATDGSRTGKYFKYAIGEILLVMIGILLALQVNNWNENRKAEAKEHKLLIELKEDLLETKNDLLTDIAKIPELRDATNALYKAILADQISDIHPYKIPKRFVLQTAILFPKLSAYEAIRSEGITIISNTKLRKEITDFYQLHIKRVAWSEARQEELDIKVLKPYLDANTRYTSRCKECKDLYEVIEANDGTPAHYYLLCRADDQLLHLLQNKFGGLRVLNRRYSALSDTIDDIIVLIDQETNLK